MTIQRTFRGNVPAYDDLNLGHEYAADSQGFWINGAHLEPMSQTFFKGPGGTDLTPYYYVADIGNDALAFTRDENIIPLGRTTDESTLAYFVLDQGEYKVVDTSTAADGSTLELGVDALDLEANGANMSVVNWIDVPAWQALYDAFADQIPPANAGAGGELDPEFWSIHNIPLNLYGFQDNITPVGGGGEALTSDIATFFFTLAYERVPGYLNESSPVIPPYNSIGFLSGHFLQYNLVLIPDDLPTDGTLYLNIYATVNGITRRWVQKEIPNVLNNTTGDVFRFDLAAQAGAHYVSGNATSFQTAEFPGIWSSAADALAVDFQSPPEGPFVAGTVLAEQSVLLAAANRIYLSTPGIPHSFPLEFSIAVPDTVREVITDSLGAIVLTDDNLYRLVAGNGIPQLIELAQHLPLHNLSRAAVVSSDFGVMYPSTEGWVHVAGNRASLMTAERGGEGRDIYSVIDWQNHIQNGLMGAVVTGRYLAWFRRISDAASFNQFAEWWFLDLSQGTVFRGHELETSTQATRIPENHPAGVFVDKGYIHFYWAGAQRFFYDYVASGIRTPIGSDQSRLELNSLLTASTYTSAKMFTGAEQPPSHMRVFATRSENSTSSSGFPVLVEFRYGKLYDAADPFSEGTDWVQVSVPDQEAFAIPDLRRAVWWQYRIISAARVLAVAYSANIEELQP